VSIVIQSNFTTGEIDPKLYTRYDLEIVKKGLRYARNVVVLPQGGVTRRFGLDYIDAATVTTTAAGIRIMAFEFMDETKYLLVFEHLSLKIYLYTTNTLVATVASPYTTAQLPNVRRSQSQNGFFTTHPDVAPYVLQRVAAHGSWTFGAIAFTYYPTSDFDQNYDAATFTPSATTGTVTVTCSAASIVKASHVNGIFSGNEGVLRITSVDVGAHTITGFTINDFKNTNAISGKLCLLTEPAWSAAYGYPKAVTFFQGRIAYGGSPKLPHAAWLSTTNDFIDFDDSEVLATSSIGVYINTSTSNIVEHLLAEKSFLVFTSTGLVSTQMLEDSPLTPTNASFNLQNADGIGTVPPVIFDNKIVYLDRGGKILWGVDYDVQRGGHVSHNISILSQHLLNLPVDMAAYRNSSDDQGNFLLIINSDGTLLILQAIDEQAVAGWTLSTTDGYFRHVAASEDIVYFVIERTINTVKKFYIEQLNFDTLLDCQILKSAAVSKVITGLSALEGKTVKVIGDGKLQTDKTVSGGSITIDTLATLVEIGLNFTVRIVPLLPPMVEGGSDLYLSKHISTLWLALYESIAVYVDNELLPFLQMDVDTFDAALTPKTGITTFTPTHGWDDDPLLEITQSEPYPFTLLSLGMKIEVAK
jgi:hypothetical protein